MAPFWWRQNQHQKRPAKFELPGETRPGMRKPILRQDDRDCSARLRYSPHRRFLRYITYVEIAHLTNNNAFFLPHLTLPLANSGPHGLQMYTLAAKVHSPCSCSQKMIRFARRAMSTLRSCGGIPIRAPKVPNRVMKKTIRSPPRPAINLPHHPLHSPKKNRLCRTQRRQSSQDSTIG